MSYNLSNPVIFHSCFAKASYFSLLQMRDNGLAVQNKNEYAWSKLRWRHGLYVFYCMVNRYGYVFMITYTTKYARWIQDSVAMFQ